MLAKLRALSVFAVLTLLLTPVHADEHEDLVGYDTVYACVFDNASLEERVVFLLGRRDAANSREYIRFLGVGEYQAIPDEARDAFLYYGEERTFLLFDRGLRVEELTGGDREAGKCMNFDDQMEEMVNIAASRELVELRNRAIDLSSRVNELESSPKRLIQTLIDLPNIPDDEQDFSSRVLSCLTHWSREESLGIVKVRFTRSDDGLIRALPLEIICTPDSAYEESSVESSVPPTLRNPPEFWKNTVARCAGSQIGEFKQAEVLIEMANIIDVASTRLVCWHEGTAP